MRSSIRISAVLLALSVVPAYAVASQELNDEATITNSPRSALAAQLPASVIVRVSQADNSVAVLQSQSKIQPGPLAGIEQAQFVSMALDDKLDSKGNLNSKELNQDSSTDSWYFHFSHGNHWNPGYGWGGYNFGYRPYYNYGFGGYNYYYYYNPYYSYNPWGWY